jgi:hypothetical protein
MYEIKRPNGPADCIFILILKEEINYHLNQFQHLKYLEDLNKD